MAAAYRPPDVVERERRLAAEFVRRRALAPPVDVRSLVEERARIIDEATPEGCDAVVIGLQRAGGLPEVVLNPSPNWRRRRFTLAHELGHLVMPWHLGTVACHVDTTDVVGAHLHFAGESEANRFAADLLVPPLWLSQVLDDSDDMSAVLRELGEAQVSAHVVCLQLARVLNPGWVFAIADGAHQILLSGRSRDTDHPVPRAGTRVASSLARFSSETHVAAVAGRTVHWWRMGDEVPLLDVAQDGRSSTEILRALTAKYAETEGEAERMFRKINGAMGFAYGKLAREQVTDAQLLGRLRSRFGGRDLPEGLLRDDDLEAYLVKRVRELKARHA